MRLPDFLLTHDATFHPYTGSGGHGDTYGDPVTAASFIEHKRQLVKNDDGSEATSETTVYTQLDAFDSMPQRSLVDLPGGVESKVVQAFRRDGGGLPVPDHWEIWCE